MNDQLLMGCACVNITPAVPVTTDGMGPGNVAKSVESDLEIRGFTFAKGEKAFTLLTCDLLHIDRKDFEIIEQKIRPEALKHWKEWSLFVAASHTHWAPVLHSLNVALSGNSEYCNFIYGKAFEAAVSTFGNMEFVSLELGKTTCSMNINRRAIVNGVSFMQPVYPEFTFASVNRIVDHEVIVAAGKRADGSYKGILVNWNCHPICFPIKYDAISSCFVGRSMNTLMKKYGCVCGYTNGALGDAAPLLGLKGAESRNMVADDLALQVSKLLESGQMYKNSSDIFETAFWEEEAKTYPEGMGFCFKEFHGKDKVSIPLGMFRIGEWASGMIPGEAFAALSLDFKKRAGVRFPQITSLTNGIYGYMIPEDEFQYGGYEPTVALCAPGDPEKIFDSLVKHI